jgi:hypothetical protein
MPAGTYINDGPAGENPQYWDGEKVSARRYVISPISVPPTSWRSYFVIANVLAGILLFATFLVRRRSTSR